MDKVIVTALLIIAGVAAAGLVVSTLTPIVGSSSRSIVESQKSVAARIATDVKVLTVHPEDSRNLKVLVKNIGTQNIELLSQSDVYLSDTNGSKFVYLVHGAGVQDDEWTVEGDDNMIVGKGKTISITVKLSTANALVSGHTYLFRFSTPNGVASEYRFTYTFLG